MPQWKHHLFGTCTSLVFVMQHIPSSLVFYQLTQKKIQMDITVTNTLCQHHRIKSNCSSELNLILWRIIPWRKLQVKLAVYIQTSKTRFNCSDYKWMLSNLKYANLTQTDRVSKEHLINICKMNLIYPVSYSKIWVFRFELLKLNT